MYVTPTPALAGGAFVYVGWHNLYIAMAAFAFVAAFSALRRMLPVRRGPSVRLPSRHRSVQPVPVERLARQRAAAQR
ncbi:hypothetical protein [Calidifontibacter indicus]|uniref:Uncharacterized protein n=1 Tax=Calidifontibacter indicus TaxID=419650 RepID=A0A3D9UW51_9MICO|nr:hypothetical protein [Calidifontibacter indicus]REF30835.1 hypothetical protein DFJ65_1857 [Calidifontibacter indicus]